MTLFIAVASSVLVLVAPVVVSATQEQPKPATPKLICKADVEVGSLIKRKKRCFSREDWQRITEAAQLGGRELQERNQGLVQ